jgi:two-component system sensor histidine kinase KdpD
LLSGLALAVAGLPLLTLALGAARHALSLASLLLIYLLAVVVIAVVGGTVPAVLAAFGSFGLANWFLTPPYHTFRIEQRDAVIALVVFVVVASTVSVAVELAARGRAAATTNLLAAEQLAEIDRLRAALLAAVGHDLRTPLAGIKAAASSLRQHDVRWSRADTEEFLATIEESADLLNEVVANLLDMSRLQAGVLSVNLMPVALDEVVARALIGGPAGERVTVEVPDDLPLVTADPGLLERVLANLVGNAHHHAAGSGPVRIVAVPDGRRVRLSVVDTGPGIDPADRERIFAPFQRLDDRRTGIGLGLAIARGFSTAMGGTLEPARTAGGGLTMVLSLPVAVP